MTSVIMLIRSANLGWHGLHAALVEMPGVDVVSCSDTSDQLVSNVQTICPDLVFLAAEFLGIDESYPLRAIHRMNPGAKLVVVGDEKSLRLEMLPILRDLRVTAYLFWDDLTQETLPLCLAVLARTNWQLASVAVANRLFRLAPGLLLPVSLVPTTALSERERGILCRLASGQTQRHIAAVEGVSERTLKRSIAHLEERFHVRSLFALGVRSAYVCASTQFDVEGAPEQIAPQRTHLR